MQDSPLAEDLIAEVREALASGIEPGFAQKVAANALGIAHRELTSAIQIEASQIARLTALGDSDGSVPQRNSRLAKAIRDGAELDHTLLAHLCLTTLEKISVDQPSYPPFKLWRGEQ